MSQQNLFRNIAAMCYLSGMITFKTDAPAKDRDVLIESIHNICITEYENDSIKDAILAKYLNLDITLVTIIGYRDDHPVCMAIIEKSTASYGNFICHALREDDIEAIEALTDAATQHPLCSGSFMELIQYYPNNPFRKIFLEKNIQELPRQRLVRYLDTPVSYPRWRSDISFRPVDSDVFDIVGEISAAGHKQSQDYPGYADLENPKNRTDLEAAVFGELYGPVLRPATLLLLVSGKPVGYICYVGIACWGEPQIPWIFDISVHPDYHGQGYGKHLLRYTLAVLQDMKYPMVGLSVTSTNTTAMNLYKDLNFLEVEHFSEFRL
jgi:ribosomal protein S18 acetylase RimI-like enzyme